MARATGGQIKRKKGEAGAAKNFITRTQAIKKLQCSISDFRRLCILKGIFPRQPNNHKKANKGSTAPASFYYVKDIQYLLHEPVLHKLREHKAFAKKLSKAVGRGEWSAAKSLEENKKPKYRLDHIIKERYPSFPDALRDLDDALSLIVLFAHLPASDQVPAAVIANCAKLAAEWQLYVMRTRSLRKVFLSIKGIYFQASIKGEIVTWLVPYMFTQNIPSDIDFRIMLTFLELYQTLLGFVFFRLYSDINLVYPPPLDASKDDEAAGLGALLLQETSRTLTIEGEAGTEADLQSGKKITTKDVKKQIRQITNASHGSTASGDFTESSGLANGDAAMDSEAQPMASTSAGLDIPKSLDPEAPEAQSGPSDEELTGLFDGYCFYLSREVTRPTLEFVIRAFGGQVGWDSVLGAGSPYSADDPRITHHIIDRPIGTGASANGSSTALVAVNHANKRASIQPQWVVDCINLRKLLPTEPYAPGSILPPHLSPFVDVAKVEEQGGYIPTEAGGQAISEGESESDVEVGDDERVIVDDEEFTGFAADEEEADAAVLNEGSQALEEERGDNNTVPRPALLAAAADPTSDALVHAAELEAESHGIPAGTFKDELAAAAKTAASGSKLSRKASKVAPAPGAVSAATQEANPASILLSNKQRKLYNKMKFGENKRSNEAEILREKKKKLLKQEKRA